MKILIINHNGGSPYHGPNLRTYYAAKSLVSRGHEVSIVSSTYSHKYSNLPPNTNAINPELVDEVNYYWVKILKYRGLVSRIFSHFQFGVRLIMNRESLPQSADVVLFSGPPPEVFLFSSLFARIIKAPVCCDVRDLWPLTQIQMSKLHLLNPYTWFLFFCEWFMYSRSVRIISPLQGISLYKNRKTFKDKVRVIPNGCDVQPGGELSSLMLNVSCSNASLSLCAGQLVDLRLLRDRFFIVGYSGSIDRDNDTETIVSAALQVDDPTILFAVVGDGVMKESLIRKSSGSGNIIFFDKVLSSQVPSVLKNMDVVYCGLKDKTIYRFGASPAKIYEYMASSKPVIWAVNAYNNPVSDAQCGVSVPPGKVKEIVDAIHKLKGMPDKELQDMGARGKAHLEENYSYKVLGDKWESVFREVANEKSY